MEWAHADGLGAQQRLTDSTIQGDGVAPLSGTAVRQNPLAIQARIRLGVSVTRVNGVQPMSEKSNSNLFSY